MKKLNIQLSEELDALFHDCFKEVSSRDLKEITVERLVYHIIIFYESRDKSGVESEVLKRILGELSYSSVLSLQQELTKLIIKQEASSRNILPDSFKNSSVIRLSEEIQVILEKIAEEEGASSTNKVVIDVESFLVMLLKNSNSAVIKLFEKYEIRKKLIIYSTMNELTDKVNEFIEGNELFPVNKEGDDKPENNENSESSSEIDTDDLFEKAGKTDTIHTRKVDPNSKTPVLDEHGINMTTIAKEGGYDAVIGRDKEVNQIIEILCCRKKNNVMLLADAGVGKTALVEYLSQKIAYNDVPRELRGKRIISLSTTNLTAGCMYRGQLEEKVQAICTEVAENRDIIIYIDEFQGATSDGSSSIAQMLKPSLSRGELTLIASTTVDEYKKFIEKDGALKRRFQKVYLNEPNSEQTFQILQGLAPKYSEYHNVNYTDEVLKACVSWSEKYLYDRHSPDRAIDLMDVVGSFSKLSNPIDDTKVLELENKVAEIKKEKQLAIEDSDFEKAANCRDKEKKLKAELEKQKSSLVSVSKKSAHTVTLEEVAAVVSNISNVPIDKIMNPEIEKLRLMKEGVSKFIIGQDEAVEAVTKLLSKQFLGIRDENIPPSLIFLGPTGTGKTKLAEVVAETVYGDSKAMLRIDCGELSQPHSVTKLLGAPPSYVGFNEPALFDQIRERPNQIILCDEFEKASDEIINTVFLNILTTGFCKLNNGQQVCFKDCIFIFTGNEGTKDLELHGSGIGFCEESKEEKKKTSHDIVIKALKKRLRPEVINRFSGIVVFNSLDKDDMKKIYVIELEKLTSRLKKKGFTLSVSDDVRDKIIDGLDLSYGARDLARGIASNVEDNICERIINEDITGKKTILVDLDKKGEIKVSFKK